MAGAEEEEEASATTSTPRRRDSLALLAVLASAGTGRLLAAPSSYAESCCPSAPPRCAVIG